MIEVKVQIDRAARQHAVGRLATQSLARVSGKVRDRAKANITVAGRVDTGQMRNQITNEVTDLGGGHYQATVRAHAEHSRFQHEGTGIYGPQGRPIVPRRAKVLRWRPRGSSTFVFRPEVSGVRPVPFLRDALRSLRPGDMM